MGQLIAAHAVLGLKLADHRIDGSAPFHVAFDPWGDAARLAGGVYLEPNNPDRSITSEFFSMDFITSMSELRFSVHTGRAWRSRVCERFSGNYNKNTGFPLILSIGVSNAPIDWSCSHALHRGGRRCARTE